MARCGSAVWARLLTYLLSEGIVIGRARCGRRRKKAFSIKSADRSVGNLNHQIEILLNIFTWKRTWLQVDRNMARVHGERGFQARLPNHIGFDCWKLWWGELERFDCLTTIQLAKKEFQGRCPFPTTYKCKKWRKILDVIPWMWVAHRSKGEGSKERFDWTEPWSCAHRTKYRVDRKSHHSNHLLLPFSSHNIAPKYPSTTFKN